MWYWLLNFPAVTLSGAGQRRPGEPAHGGTVPVVALNGTTLATATGATVVVPIGGYIPMTYISAPTWVWSAAVGGPSAGIGEGALVSGTAPVGGQAGVLPQYTFLEGTAIDPAGPLTAAIRRSPRSFYAAGAGDAGTCCGP